jgi:hypothetical protein
MPSSSAFSFVIAAPEPQSRSEPYNHDSRRKIKYTYGLLLDPRLRGDDKKGGSRLFGRDDRRKRDFKGVFDYLLLFDYNNYIKLSQTYAKKSNLFHKVQ